MIIGIWSVFRVVNGLQTEPIVRCAETIEKSDYELGSVRVILVGSLSSRRASWLLWMRLSSVGPRKEAWLSYVWEK